MVIPTYPSSAAGPDLRQLIVGSEGRFGVITRATVRIRRVPQRVEIVATLLPSWQNGLEGARELLQLGVPLNLLRCPTSRRRGGDGHRLSAIAGWRR